MYVWVYAWMYLEKIHSKNISWLGDILSLIGQNRVKKQVYGGPDKMGLSLVEQFVPQGAQWSGGLKLGVITLAGIRHCVFYQPKVSSLIQHVCLVRRSLFWSWTWNIYRGLVLQLNRLGNLKNKCYAMRFWEGDTININRTFQKQFFFSILDLVSFKFSGK